VFGIETDVSGHQLNAAKPSARMCALLSAHLFGFPGHDLDWNHPGPARHDLGNVLFYGAGWRGLPRRELRLTKTIAADGPVAIATAVRYSVGWLRAAASKLVRRMVNQGEYLFTTSATIALNAFAQLAPACPRPCFPSLPRRRRIARESLCIIVSTSAKPYSRSNASWHLRWGHDMPLVPADCYG